MFRIRAVGLALTRYRAAFHRILPLQMIRQCVVLEEFGLILILTHNVCLFCPARSSYSDVVTLQDLCAYDLESCVPTSTGPQTSYPPQKLNRRGDVSFFRVGTVNGKVYVIFPRRKRVRRHQIPALPNFSHTSCRRILFSRFLKWCDQQNRHPWLYNQTRNLSGSVYIEYVLYSRVGPGN